MGVPQERVRLSNEQSEMDVVAVAPKAISGRIGLGLKISRQGYAKSTFSFFSILCCSIRRGWIIDG